MKNDLVLCDKSHTCAPRTTAFRNKIVDVINAKDNDGTTPFHFAAQYNSVDVLQYLVSIGADVNAKDNDGETPLDHAKEDGSTLVFEYLSSVMSKVGTGSQGHLLYKFL